MYLQGNRDERSGLKFVERVFVSQSEYRRHSIRWLLVDVLIQMLVVSGTFYYVVTGFSIPVTVWFFPILCLCTLVFTGVSGSTFSKKKKWFLSGALFFLFLGFLYLTQEEFLEGAGAFYYQIRNTVSLTYSSNPAEQQAQAVRIAALPVSCFMGVVGALGALWICYSIIVKESFLMAMVLLLPVIVLTAVCGGAKNVIAMFMILFGILLCFISTRTVRHKRLWGYGNQALYENNVNRFQSIQKKNILVWMMTAMLLTVPGFYLVKPVLSVQLRPAEQVAGRIRNSFLSMLLSLLPDISAEKLNLEVELTGGGVSDGALQDEDGYQLKGVEDLKVSVSTKPEETIFLKGYVGSRYMGTAWEGGYETTFEASSFQWPTSGNRSLYTLNLPFLRMDYAQAQAASGQSEIMKEIVGNAVAASEISVSRINANSKYTYVPYGAYLNDYYVVENGDGPVAGQSDVEDRFYFYYRDDCEKILSLWNQIDGKDHSLEQVENYYHAYCVNNYLEVAEGLDSLEEKIQEEKKRGGLSPEFDTARIVSWVKAFLAENYTYDINVTALEEGEDFLTNFLFESKTGYSIHFASAAVEMFRMFGIPARYVIGYEIPKGLFSVQPGGTYTATVQDDNAQAWAEIYISGIGWTPVDATPGVVGTYEEVGEGGEKVKTYEHEKEELEWDPEEMTSDQVEEPTVMEGIRNKVNEVFHTDFTVEQVVNILALTAALIVACTVMICMGTKHLKAYGYDIFHRRTALERFVNVFGTYYRKLEKCGLPENADSASKEFVEFAMRQCRNEEQKEILPEVVEKLYQCCYGDKETTEDEIRAVRKLIRHMKK